MDDFALTPQKWSHGSSEAMPSPHLPPRDPMHDTVVFTSIVQGRGRDVLRDDQNSASGVFLAFVDRSWNSSVWTELPAYARFLSPRRNSRAPKILAHEFLDCRYSLWIDGRIALKTPVDRLVQEWLSDADLAVFSHPVRGCAYDEAEECATRRLDDPGLIREQSEKYRRAGQPRRAGLAENSIILRRHSATVERFNNAWWAEYCRYSVRDQISFMYAALTTGVRIRWLSPEIRANHFDISPRGAEAEPRADPISSRIRAWLSRRGAKSG